MEHKPDQDKKIPSGTMPHFPQGYILPDGGKEKLPWEYIRQRMQAAKNYWIATAGLDGKPAATPVWGVWLDDRLYFDGSPQTRRGRNIASNPYISVHLESGDEAVMLDGRAEIFAGAPERQLAERISTAYCEKYAAAGYAPKPDQWDEGGLFEFVPQKVIAWTNFTKDPTRWILKP